MVQHYRKKVGQRSDRIKLHKELKNEMLNQDINIGIDKFYRFLRHYNLLVPKIKNYHKTTDSNHHFRKYKNKVLTRPEQRWVNDITYIKTQNGHNYLALVTDAYSKQLMGYKLDNHMRTSFCTDALKMALKNRKYPNKKLIHHSGRGFQYCNPKYTQFAESNGLTLSMTEKYAPYENAIAERINKTLKYEYGLRLTLKNTKLAQKIAKRTLNIYNNIRPHLSLDLHTPKHVHLNQNVKYKSYRKNKLELLTL